MKRVTLLAVVGVIGVSIIACIVVFQFIQGQGDRQVEIKQNLQEEYDRNLEAYSNDQGCFGMSNQEAYEACIHDQWVNKYHLDDEKYKDVNK